MYGLTVTGVSSSKGTIKERERLVGVAEWGLHDIYESCHFFHLFPTESYVHCTILKCLHIIMIGSRSIKKIKKTIFLRSHL